MASSSSSLMQNLWQTHYNSEESLLPLLVSFAFFAASFVYAEQPFTTLAKRKQHPPSWFAWPLIHDIFNFVAIVLGWISLYYQDDSIFHERIVNLWCTGYFLVDIYAMAVQERDIAYTIHAVLCLSACYACLALVPTSLRFASRGVQCELSSSVLNIVRRTKKPAHFAIFAVVFFLCRLVYIPLGIILPVSEYLAWTHWFMVALYAFYGLNCFWFYKIVRVMLGKKKKREQSDGKEEKSK